MKTYKDILAEINRLQKIAAKQKHAEKHAIIAEIKKKMNDFEITLDDLRTTKPAKVPAHKIPAGKVVKKATKASRIDKRSSVAPKFRDPESGATWSGRGLAPKWLLSYEKAGRTRADFLIGN